MWHDTVIDWRSIKARARQDVHQQMQVSAVLVRAGASPLPVQVRLHTNAQIIGSLGPCILTKEVMSEP